MARLRLSLATKCQFLFGLAVLLILIAALAWPWLRMRTLVEEGQRQTARRLSEAWLAAEPSGEAAREPAAREGAVEQPGLPELTAPRWHEPGLPGSTCSIVRTASS